VSATTSIEIKRRPGVDPASQPEEIDLLLSEIVSDNELQSRLAVDWSVIEQYTQHIRDGGKFPPVTVFRIGSFFKLVDGWHRVAAHRTVAGTDPAATIRCSVHRGEQTDALRFALGANSAHGKPRSRADLECAFQKAIDNRLVEPTDVAGVAQLLRCSATAAGDLTRAARAEIEAARRELRRTRDEGIIAAKAAGKSQREIAAEVGISQPAVHKIIQGG
jgi:hypothetical protein